MTLIPSQTTTSDVEEEDGDRSLPATFDPKPPQTTAGDFDRANVSASTAPLKLRPRYVETDPLDAILLVPATQTTVTRSGAPRGTPRAISPISHQTGKESKQAPSFDEVPGPHAVDITPLASVVERVQKSNGQPGDGSAENDFPTKKVLELKRRLDTAAALQPGEISRIVTADLSDDSEDRQQSEDGSNGLFSVRSLKHRDLFRDLPAETSIAPRDARKPTTARAAMIQWRAVNESRPESQAARNPDKSQSSRLPEDLRQSMREKSTSTREILPSSTEKPPFSLPLVSGGLAIGNATSGPDLDLLRMQRVVEMGTATKAFAGNADDSSHSGQRSVQTELRGSLWDNATAPSIEGYSGSIQGASIPIESVSEQSNDAPLPPRIVDVEQTSFYSPGELINRQHRTRSDRRPPLATERETPSAPIATSTESVARPLESYAPRRNRAVKTQESDQAESSRAILASNVIERLAILFGIPISTASSMLCAAGLAMLIAGLWMVRAAVAVKKT